MSNDGATRFQTKRPGQKRLPGSLAKEGKDHRVIEVAGTRRTVFNFLELRDSLSTTNWQCIEIDGLDVKTNPPYPCYLHGIVYLPIE